MVTEQEEETQAKEFLKRAEIRTMKKDLLQLREADSLKEREKIATIKTLDEQLEEKKKADAIALAKSMPEKEKMQREEVLEKNAGQEKIAEKELKNYATEEERQQIFFLESQRLGFEKQVDEIDKEKDPELKLDKNKLLLLKREQQKKLDEILDQEKKLEEEGKGIKEREQITTIPAERKGLEGARWDLDKKIQDIEKKRWEAEKLVEDTDEKASQIDKSSDQLILDKNGLRDKILGIDKSLRDIYSAVMAREEEKRMGQTQEQLAKRVALEKIQAKENESVQRREWTGSGAREKAEKFMGAVPAPARRKILQTADTEEIQRKKFLEDVSVMTEAPVPPKKSS
jgi:hypothetical protein